MALVAESCLYTGVKSSGGEMQVALLPLIHSINTHNRNCHSVSAHGIEAQARMNLSG